MLVGARQRAAAAGVPFAITKNDIVIPRFCPVFGVKLEKGTKGNNPNAPSLDRVIPSLGYVIGNIIVISQRANVLKRDATLTELNRLVAWLNAREFDSAWNRAETRRALTLAESIVFSTTIDSNEGYGVCY